MRKVIAAILLFCGSNAFGQFAAQWYFQDPTQAPQGVKQVYLTGLWNITVVGTTNINLGLRLPKQTDTHGSLVVSNLVYGGYRVEVVTASRTNSFTNCFDTTITTNSLVNAADYICVGTNTTSSSDYAYTRAQSDARFGTNSSGGSATNAYRSQVSGSGLIISTNVSSLIYTFVLNAALQAWSVFTPTAYSNGFYSLLISSNTSYQTQFAASNTAYQVQFNSGTNFTHGVSNNVLAKLGTNNGVAFGLEADTNSASANIALRVVGGLVFINNNTPTTGNTNFVLQLQDGSLEVADFATLVASIAGGGGSGTVTSVALTPPSGHSVSGSPITGAGTFVETRTSTENFLNFGVTNLGFFTMGLWRVSTNATTNSLIIATTNAAVMVITSNGIPIFNGAGVTNVASTNVTGLLPVDAATSTNNYASFDSSGGLVGTRNGGSPGWTNSITWSNALTVTNFPVLFDGQLHSITVTNGPDVFITTSGANGSVSFQIESNVTLHLPGQIKWLAGSNSVITNGVLSLTSYGGTNRIKAAMKENQ